MDDLQLVKQRLEQTPISELHELADRTGVPFGTLHKIKYGKTKNPRFDTVRLLVEYYQKAAA